MSETLSHAIDNALYDATERNNDRLFCTFCLFYLLLLETLCSEGQSTGYGTIAACRPEQLGPHSKRVSYAKLDIRSYSTKRTNRSFHCTSSWCTRTLSTKSRKVQYSPSQRKALLKWKISKTQLLQISPFASHPDSRNPAVHRSSSWSRLLFIYCSYS